jgi:hypothetical protein
MVLPVKVFEIRSLEGNPMNSLTGWREVEDVEGEDDLKLVTEILEMEENEGVIKGIFAKDFYKEYTYRRKVMASPQTEEAVFWILKYGERAKISAETLKRLHESNPQATNLIWFDNIDLPGVDKLCLSGQGLADTGMYKEYIDHGLIWYVVFTSQPRGYTIGITRGIVITNFSKCTVDEFIEFVRDDILKLVEA